MSCGFGLGFPVVACRARTCRVRRLWLRPHLVSGAGVHGACYAGGDILKLEGRPGRPAAVCWVGSGSTPWSVYFRRLRHVVFCGLLRWLKARVGDDPVADRAGRPRTAQVAEVAAPQSDQADRADRQRDCAEPD